MLEDYPLLRSRRKTVGIYLRPDGSFEVRAPLHLSRCEIDRFVASREDWIREKSALLRDRAARQAQTLAQLPNALPLLGRAYPLEEGSPAAFTGVSFRLPPGSPEETRRAAARVYRSLAADYLPRRVEYWQARVCAVPASLRIGSAKGSWGSCSGKGALTFSWRLMTASPECVDYVVVHELCHLLELNHSPRFWTLVARHVPQWQSCRRTLDSLGAALLELGL